MTTNTIQNLQAEKDWYTKPNIKKNHFLMKWPFANLARQEYAHKYVRKNARKTIKDYLVGRIFERALVAACGDSGDQDILGGISKKYFGIDVSEVAVERCRASHKDMIVKEGDILNNGYENDFFDLIGSILFFHYLHKVGFDPFLKEFNRIMKKGGILIILEPSALSFFSWLTGLGKKVFGNISGLVPDEAPIVPSKLNSALEKAGFKIERLQALTFSHNRIPRPVQRLINVITYPLQGIFPFSQTGWMCLWICKKV